MGVSVPLRRDGPVRRPDLRIAQPVARHGAGLPRAAARPPRRPAMRRRHRRGRLHGPLDRVLPASRRPVAAHRGPRVGDRRLRRARAATAAGARPSSPSSSARIASEHGRDLPRSRMQRAMFDTVDEVGKVCADEGIDCHFAKGGTTHFATNAAQLGRLRAEVDEAARARLHRRRRTMARRLGRPRPHRRRRRARRARSPRTARRSIRPGSCAVSPTWSSALASRSSSDTRVQSIGAGRVAHGARHGAGARRRARPRAAPPTLAGSRRAVAPIYSLMMATEPLPTDVLGRDRTGRAARRCPTDGT